MKTGTTVLFLLPAIALGIERRDLDLMLATAAGATGQPYIEARSKITDLGTNALPILAESIADNNMIWQQHLVARICYERMVRKDDIDGLKNLDWQNEPGYDRNWQRDIVGPGSHMAKLAQVVFTDRGLWYYYLEIIWKDTREWSTGGFCNTADYWARWCQLAAENQPERFYLPKVMIERVLDDSEMKNDESIRLYRNLRDSKYPEAVAIMIQRVSRCIRRSRDPSLTDAEFDKALFYEVKLLLSFADSRSAEHLSKYIDEHGVLAPLKTKMAEVKLRPVPRPVPEPPFRLGTHLVTVAQ